MVIVLAHIAGLFKTNNPVADAIILSILGTLIATGISKFTTLVSQLSFYSMYLSILNMTKNIYNFLLGKKEFIKQVTISSISDEKKRMNFMMRCIGT